MRKLTGLIIVAILLFAVPAYSFDEVVPAPVGQFTLLNAVVSTGIGTEVDLGRMYGKFICTVTWSGTAPTNTVVSVLFSDKSGVYDSTGLGIPAQTVTASPTVFQITSYYGRYLKGNYVSKSAGDGTTAVTITCSPLNF
jgi:hypothetical protein